MRHLALIGLLAAAVGTSQPAHAARKDPPRFTRGSYAERIVVKRRNGQVEVREVYTGYTNGWPKPAWLYYGYPHSGDDTGIGPLDIRR